MELTSFHSCIKSDPCCTEYASPESSEQLVMLEHMHTFNSSLIQDTIDDALLHLLWRYKGKIYMRELRP